VPVEEYSSPWAAGEDQRYRVCIEDIADRAVAAFLGFAIGDALGATAEFLTPGEVRSTYGVLQDICGGGWLQLPAGAVTDDTEMSLCVARSLTSVGFSPKDIADRFVVWLKSKPRDVGGTCRRGIRRYMTEGSLAAACNEADGGNGAAMRIVPVALATVGDTTVFADWALRQAHITHHHPLSDAACILLGQLLHLALVGHSKRRMLALVQDFLVSFPIFKYDQNVPYCSAYIVDTLRTVLKAFFSTQNMEECVVATVNWGGDADTAGAIAGAIAGAYYGLKDILPCWTKKLDQTIASEVKRLALELIALSPATRNPESLNVCREYFKAGVR
jgi:ADP-ribosyl-[dinitrogen reductase] hydrolase